MQFRDFQRGNKVLVSSIHFFHKIFFLIFCLDAYCSFFSLLQKKEPNPVFKSLNFQIKIPYSKNQQSPINLNVPYSINRIQEYFMNLLMINFQNSQYPVEILGPSLFLYW